MQKKPLSFIWNYTKDFKYKLLFIVFLTLLGRFALQIGLYFSAKMFSFAGTEQHNPKYWETIALFIAVFVVVDLMGHLLQSWSMYISGQIIPHIRSLVIKDTFDYVNKHSISYFTNEMTGNISNKFNQLQNGVAEFFMHSSNTLFDTGYLLVNIIILSYVNWILGFATIVWAVLMILVGKYFGLKRAELSRKTSGEQSLSNARIVDSIANYSEIKSFANFKYERSNLLKVLRKWRHAETYEQKQRNIIMMSLGIISVFSGACFCFLSLLLFYFNRIDLTVFIFVLTISLRLSGIAFGVNWSVNNLSRTFGSINSALETLAVEPEIVDSENATELVAKKAEITFENVNFFYQKDQPIFTDFNLKIKSGEKVGIVGTSGAGKSTLIKLVARYFDTTSGSIKINGTDIKDVTQDSLHRTISTIPQDVCLFNRTLEENIRYGKTTANLDEIKTAAKQASADKFIEKLAKGYETKVGDRGVILSGGERQRIAIARAILKDSPILIFDEATSSLDSESEKYIQESMKTLMKNKTVIAVAHRLSTLREMDRIVVLDNGKIIEEGTHLGLLRKKGRYAKLFKMQSDGYLQLS
ncbi:MAG: ABC transporter ATP-binding protein [Alphaproteobacteria bacterium]|nr:ABC transporter ATP-binding protein [Alphaproteobacteria bacterium]